MMAEEQGTNEFTMHGAREVLPLEAPFIEQQVIAIEKAVIENPALAFDLAKTLIETTCKTIMKDRGHEYDEAWDLPRLLKETISRLKLVPDGCENARDVTDSLRKTVGGLQTVIQGICELRNTQGFSSHGKDAYTQQLETVQAQFVAKTADVIVNFLFKSHRHYPSLSLAGRLSYGDNPELNDYVDEANTLIHIFNYTYKPSEVLFNLDEEAYREILANYKEDHAERDNDEGKEPKEVDS